MASETVLNGNACTWYHQCTCCPYGYHIDLDFVRYCEYIGQQVERSGSIKRRKDRRRQRQSMEVLLGLSAPLAVAHHAEPQLATIPDHAAVRLPQIQDALDEVVSDFERTLQRSKKSHHTNLPDVTVNAVTGDSSPARRDFDTVSNESCGHSPANLQNIREQMALSLERTRELEEMVKIIPSLQAQLSSLKEENKCLHTQLRAEEESKLNKLNSNYLINPCVRNRSNSFSNIDLMDYGGAGRKPVPPLRRDFGVTAGVLTRNVGVGNQTLQMKSVSTATNQEPYVDKWYVEKTKFLGANINEAPKKICVAKGTQTIFWREKRDCEVQTLEVPVVKALTRESAVQTILNRTVKLSVATNTQMHTTNVETQYENHTHSVGVSDDRIDDVFCAKCNVLRRTIGVGTTEPLDDNLEAQSISLASLGMNRSKSFHLGETKLGMTPTRATGTQYESTTFTLNKSCQVETKTSTKHSQHDITYATKGVQLEYSGQTKCTDTSGLGPVMKHKASECSPEKPRTVEVSCNTTPIVSVTPTTPVTPKDKDSTCRFDGSEEGARKEEVTPPSRIPRRQVAPTTPVESRKFKRQDTYTKIPAGEKPFTGLSALELVTAKIEPSSSLDEVKQKYTLPEVKKPHNGTIETAASAKPPSISESTLCQPPSPRKKCVPSKEMQGAMKVLHDSLQKSHGRDVRGQLKNANAIVEAEWFRISSTATADPLDVEDYLDSFEDVSSNLLQYIVNMVDASGNTAMHYAVSHGNFDVVSILLDSKVCDINKQNKAGYTSVMLVSLAEVRSPTHANVVRRLFSLADVNIRAKQHGQTALMLAVSHGRLDMVSMLLEAGADVNIQDEDGSTALMCAAEHGHVDIVKHFLSHPDCDSSISDVDGSTALKIAMEAGHRHIGVLLYAHERNLHTNAPVRPKKSKSSSASPKTPSSPLLQRSSTNRSNK